MKAIKNNFFNIVFIWAIKCLLLPRWRVILSAQENRDSQIIGKHLGMPLLGEGQEARLWVYSTKLLVFMTVIALAGVNVCVALNVNAPTPLAMRVQAICPVTSPHECGGNAADPDLRLHL